LWLQKLERLPEAAGSLALVELKARILAEHDQGAQAVDLVEEYLKQPDAPRRLLWAATLFHHLDLKHVTRQNRVVYSNAAENLYGQLKDKEAARVLDLISFLGRRGRTEEALKHCEDAWQTAPVEAVGFACVAVLRASPSTAEQQKRVERWLLT